MDTLKPFDPDDIDESLTRIVTRGSDTYLLFPYLDALATLPKFNSIGRVIRGPAATVARARGEVSRILAGQDDRLVVIVGPCSIHDPAAASRDTSQSPALRE